MKTLVKKTSIENQELPSIDEIIQDVKTSSYKTATDIDSRASEPIVGEIIDVVSKKTSKNQVLVRCVNEENVVFEQWVAYMRGLDLKKGNRVLLSKAKNWPVWIIVGVIEEEIPFAEETQLDIKVDGKRIEVNGKDEIVLRCGEASITLRRNGRIMIRGVYVETRAKGTNRIKGGSVLIN